MLDTQHPTGDVSVAQGVVNLSDGRSLSFAEYGDPKGSPVFHFHGHPGSRLDAAILHEPAIAAGVRLIGVDRPGMGMSDYQKRRRLLDWPADLASLADVLGLERFAVQGISGGGPYAAVSALALPDRLTAVGILSSAGATGLGDGHDELPINRLQRRLAGFAPFMLDVAFASMARSVRSSMRTSGPAAVGRAALGGLPAVDQAAISQPNLAARYGMALEEAFRQGGRGAAHEAKLLSRPWGFNVSAIRHPNVHIWHGGLDRNVSIASGRAMAAAIPGAKGSFDANEGHISVVMTHASEILNAMRGMQK